MKYEFGFGNGWKEDMVDLIQFGWMKLPDLISVSATLFGFYIVVTIWRN